MGEQAGQMERPLGPSMSIWTARIAVASRAAAKIDSARGGSPTSEPNYVIGTKT
jgi:hypothetical protein